MALIETRPYFLLGDLVSNLGVGALVGSLSALLFGPGWNMLVAMVVGMALGMLVAIPFALLLGALFGAMEIMVPVMTTGMVAGMVVSMGAAMEPCSFARGAQLGALSGLGAMVAIYLANALIRGRTSHWTS
jgi:hypothetical protein